MFRLNEGQQFVVEEAVKWYYNSHEQVFQYDGPPGSGKSVVLMEIIKRLGLDIMNEIAPMSFIGSASLVMRLKGLLSSKTIHSWLYNVKEVDALGYKNKAEYTKHRIKGGNKVGKSYLGYWKGKS